MADVFDVQAILDKWWKYEWNSIKIEKSVYTDPDGDEVEAYWLHIAMQAFVPFSADLKLKPQDTRIFQHIIRASALEGISCGDIDVSDLIKANKWSLHWILRWNDTSRFQKREFWEGIENWDVSSVTDMSEMFLDNRYFNHDISKWDVSNVMNMDSMFEACGWFNQDISWWDVSNVRSMSFMFDQCVHFNQSLNGWDVSNVNNMKGMFSYCSEFNQPLDKWDVGSVRWFNNMFSDCRAFNQDISMRNIGERCGEESVTLNNMFNQCVGFNNNVHNLVTNKVTNISGMFLNCVNFEGRGVETWDVSNVEEAQWTFQFCRNFVWDLSWWKCYKMSNIVSILVGAIKWKWEFPYHTINFWYLQKKMGELLWNIRADVSSVVSAWKYLPKRPYNYFLWAKVYHLFGKNAPLKADIFATHNNNWWHNVIYSIVSNNLSWNLFCTIPSFIKGENRTPIIWYQYQKDKAKTYSTMLQIYKKWLSWLKTQRLFTIWDEKKAMMIFTLDDEVEIVKNNDNSDINDENYNDDSVVNELLL